MPPRPDFPPSTALLDVVKARFSSLSTPHRRVTLASNPTPQPAQVLTDRQLSVTIQGHAKAVQTRDLSWIVWVPWGWTATVTAVASSVGPVSSALNVPGSQGADLHHSNVSLPLTVNPIDSLIVMSGSAGGNPAPVYGFSPPTSSAVDEAMAVVFVPYEPFDGYFRPPAVGSPSNPIIQWMRADPWPEALMDISLLPSVINVASLYQPVGPIPPGGWNQSPPTFAESLAIHRRFHGDIYSDWRVADRCPWANGHQGYGQNVMDAMSDAMCLLCSTATQAEKEPLALALCQQGIDNLARACDGLWLYPSGGHCWGRKIPVILMGHLFKIPAFANPTPWIGLHFAEDHYKAVPQWWWGGGPTWTTAWPFALSTNMDGGAVQQRPTEWIWGDPFTTVDSEKRYAWACRGYYQHVVGVTLGSALALKLMGAGANAPGMIEMCEQHMHRPPIGAENELIAAGINNMGFETDYGAHERFTAEAWKAYGGL